MYSSHTPKPPTPEKRIARQLFNHFFYQDNPPAKSLTVPVDYVYHEHNDVTLWNAKLVYETDYVTPRTHEPKIQFEVDKDLNIKKDSIIYV